MAEAATCTNPGSDYCSNLNILSRASGRLSEGDVRWMRVQFPPATLFDLIFSSGLRLTPGDDYICGSSLMVKHSDFRMNPRLKCADSHLWAENRRPGGRLLPRASFLLLQQSFCAKVFMLKILQGRACCSPVTFISPRRK